jgi:soluble lytic murein transglycosylase-like protein
MTKVLLAVAIPAVSLLAPPAQAHAICRSVECSERVARKQCAQSRPVPCIRRAALHWRVPVDMLVRKARCESRLDPGAWNPSGAIGLLQFLPSTWRSTPYADESPWRAKWAALAGAWMHRVGRGGEWVCQ